MSEMSRPSVAGDLEPALEAALARPGHVHGRGAAVLEAHDHDRVVLAGRAVAVDEGVAPRERLADRQLLAEQVARGLDAVRRHVEQRAAAGQSRRPRNGRACGPLCASRARKVTGVPMPPASIISRIRTISAPNTTFSR